MKNKFFKIILRIWKLTNIPAQNALFENRNLLIKECRDIQYLYILMFVQHKCKILKVI